jgi:hypothetical protein
VSITDVSVAELPPVASEPPWLAAVFPPLLDGGVFNSSGFAQPTAMKRPAILVSCESDRNKGVPPERKTIAASPRGGRIHGRAPWKFARSRRPRIRLRFPT